MVAYPFIECYYDLGLNDKADHLMVTYCNNIIEYIEYYNQFEGEKADLVENLLFDKFDELQRLYYLAAFYNRDHIVRDMNDYYRSFGADNKDLILTPAEKDSLGIEGVTNVTK